LVLPTESVFRH